MYRLTLAFVLLFLCRHASAQDLSGTWEGTEEGNYMKLVIVKVGDRYVGYTYDTDPSGGWCRANFAGTFYPDTKKVKGSGQGMIAMQGSHVQCIFDLNYSRSGNSEHLVGIERTKGNDSFFSNLLGLDDGPVELRRVTRKVDTTEYMRRYIADAHKPRAKTATAPLSAKPVAIPSIVKKTTAKVPVAKAPAAKAIVPKTTTSKINVPKTTAAAKPGPTPSVSKTRTVKLPVDSAAKTAAPPRVTAKAPAIAPAVNEQLLTLKKERRSSIVQEIETEEPVITIRVFDNGVPDGDTVSILHNNTVVADHMLVAVNYFEFTVRINEETPVHDITLIAHNLGSIAPNTASLTIIAGEQRYRLTASTDLGRNAVIRVRYKKR
jgi:hypothetical protein